MSQVANSSCFVSLTATPPCCVYAQTPLVAQNNNFVNGYPVLIAGFYGLRFNQNFGCASPCLPEPLFAAGSGTNSYSNGLPKLKLGDFIGTLGGVIIGTPTNTFIR
jgi:hypothetical protein